MQGRKIERLRVEPCPHPQRRGRLVDEILLFRRSQVHEGRQVGFRPAKFLAEQRAGLRPPCIVMVRIAEPAVDHIDAIRDLRQELFRGKRPGGDDNSQSGSSAA